MPTFEGFQLRTSLLSTALNRAQLLSLSQALTWVQPHVAQPVLLCTQNTVRQLRGLQQGLPARLKAHTQFMQQALGAAGQSVDSLRPAVTRFQECLPRLWRIPGTTGARRHFGASLSMVYQAARLPALYHAFVLCTVVPQHSRLLHIASMPSVIALSRRRCAGSLLWHCPLASSSPSTISD
jgi:hypothetical protein